MKKQVDEEQSKRIIEQIEFAKRMMEARAKDAEAFLLTFHVVKDGRIYHHFDYEDFKTADFGPCIIALAVEANRAQQAAATGGSKVSPR